MIYGVMLLLFDWRTTLVIALGQSIDGFIILWFYGLVVHISNNSEPEIKMTYKNLFRTNINIFLFTRRVCVCAQLSSSVSRLIVEPHF